MDTEVKAIENSKVETYFKYKRMVYFAIKRTFDIFCALIGVLCMLPAALVIKMCYMLTGDFKSIFYRQKRVGKNGKIIGIYKFRSMVPNAGEVLEELLKDPERKKEWDANQKFDDDPRITKVGKIIRKLSIDELPQFINVLNNDMSLIGPRPLVEGELDAHKGNHDIYEKVKPGITGWWACNGRNALTYKKRLELEYYYAEHCSLKLDIKCIFLTILAVVKRDGAK
jgi:undecaprenyl-phosphate galactose phosphotransferase